MAVYWLGQNGNVYLKGDDGQVVNKGTPYNGDQKYLQNVGADTTAGSFEATRIADPNAPPAATTPAPVSGGKTYAPLNTGAVNNTQIALDQLPALLSSALGSEDQSYKNTTGGYDASQANQQKVYDGSTVTNQQNYDGNYMDSIRAGIKGVGSLVNILRGSGAAGGTAEDLARNVVGDTTANDIRNGSDTQKANQGSLDSSLSNFLTDLKGKRQVADDTHTNNIRAINHDSNTQMQDLLGKMAGYYGDAGNTGKANALLGQAGALTPQIAQNSMTKTSAYDQTPVAVQAPQVTAFAAPSQPDVAVAPQDGQVGSGIFSMNRKKEDSTPVAAPVGA